MFSRFHFREFGLVLFVGCLNAHAADGLDRIYVRTSIGPSFTEDTSAVVRYRLPLQLPKRVLFSPAVRFGAGVRGDLALGYQVTNPLAVELECSAIWNSVQFTPDGTYQIPLTANLLYRVPLSRSWKAYLGAGVGGTVSIFEVAFSGFPPPVQTRGTSLAFTYQAQAGFQHSLSRHVDIGLGYKFTHVDPNEWHPFQGFQGTERIESLNNHMVLLSATYKF